MNDDESLVLRAQRGDRQAVETLLGRLTQRVFAICCHFLGERGAAEDAAQDALVRIFTRIGELREPARLTAWSATLTANLCRDRLRLRPRPVPLMDDIAGGVDPAAATADEDVRATLAAAVARLPEAMRQVFLLRQVEGLATEEVAAALNIPLGTVKSRLFEARRRLRELLEPMEEVRTK